LRPERNSIKKIREKSHFWRNISRILSNEKLVHTYQIQWVTVHASSFRITLAGSCSDF
jgi:hypothetical protein